MVALALWLRRRRRGLDFHLPPQLNRGPAGSSSIEGFGVEAKGDEKQAMLRSYRSYLGAIGAKDYRSACGLLAEQVRESLAQLA